MKLTDLIVNPKSVGQHLILTGVRPAVEYQNGKRTDNIVGYRYDVVMPDHAYERLSVRIDGEQQMELGESEHVEVAFDGLDLYVYWLNGAYTVGARATGIHIVQPQQKQTKTTQ